MIVRERSGWSVYSEGTPRRRLGGPYSSQRLAANRLRQVEYFKRRHDARPRRLPRLIPPTRLEEDYARSVIKIIKRATSAWDPVMRMLPDLVDGAVAARSDAGESGKLRKLIEHAVANARQAIKQDELESLARKLATRVSSFHKDQFTKQVRAALGSDPIIKDRGLAARVEQFTHENVALIKRIPERLHGDMEALVTRAISSGRLAGGRGRGKDTLRADIQARFGVSERHARLICRDQSTKFFGSLNHARQRELGITKFIWRTAGDERVREEHAELDGETFEYEDPPEVDGEISLPSEPIQCRCWAEGIYEDLQDDSEESSPEDADEPDTED